MRHAAVSAAQWVNQRDDEECRWDLIFCSSMLDVATWRGLLVRPSPPCVVYFHENQLTYPDPTGGARDLHFGITNWTTSLAADSVWFNSHFHLQNWDEAIRELLGRMPAPSLHDSANGARCKYAVQSPGILPIEPASRPPETPLSIVWAARWEHDKRPDLLLDAVVRLREQGVQFSLSVLGESFGRQPDCMDVLRQNHSEVIAHWGMAEVADYRQILKRSDVFLSTADHEFFGVSAVEAMSAGCYPILPNRLSYPELICDGVVGATLSEHLYDGQDELVNLLSKVHQRKRHSGSVWLADPLEISRTMRRYHWEMRCAEMDTALEAVASVGPRKRIR